MPKRERTDEFQKGQQMNAEGGHVQDAQGHHAAVTFGTA